MFVLPTFSLGVIGSPTVIPETFDTATLENGQNGAGNNNTLTLTIQPSSAIAASGTITLAGLTGSQTADSGSLTIGGDGAAIFGSSGSWTQSSGTLVLTVAGGQSVPTGSNTVITFTLTNPATTNAGVTGITLASSGFTTANISGTFLNAIAIFNVTTRDTEANIKASTPTNPSGEVNIAYGTDTNDFYIWDGSAWYIYNNTRFDIYSLLLDGTDDYLTTNSGFSNIFSGSFSISLWVKTPSTFTAGADTLMGTTSTAGKGYLEFRWTYVSSTTAILTMYTTNSYSTSPIYATEVRTTSANLANNAWSNIIFTADRPASGTTSAKIYINNSLQATTGVSPYRPTLDNAGGTWDQNLYLGARNSGSPLPMQGNLDNIAFFDYVLSTDQIATIYNGGGELNLEALSVNHWWKMEEGTGTTVADSGADATSDTTGTFNSVPQWSTVVQSN